MNPLRAGNVAFWAAVPVLVVCTVLAQEPRPDVMIVMGPPLPVEGLAGLWAKMPDVVLATAHSASAPQLDAAEHVVRHQSFTVKDVLKDQGGTLVAGEAVVVSHPGGTLVVDGRRYRTELVEEVALDGEEVVLFLSGPGQGQVHYLPYGYFVLNVDQTVVMRGTTRSFVRSLPREWTRSEFLEALRQLRTPQ